MQKRIENLLGTNGPIGFDPGGHDFKHPRTPLQSAPPLSTIQCWVPGLHLVKEHALIYDMKSRNKIITILRMFIVSFRTFSLEIEID